jgi:HPr kinase/phosphorylase
VTEKRVRVTAGQLIQDPHLAPLQLRLVAGEGGLDREIYNPRLQKPGLALAGYLPYLRGGRVQVIGESETLYLGTLGDVETAARIDALVGVGPPLIVVTKGMDQTASWFVDACTRHRVPLAVTELNTSEAIERLSGTLEYVLATRDVRHGDLLDIFAIGVLLLGESGSGKSECALELVHRGHRLVADDVVEIARIRQDELVGQAPQELRGLMEVRGLGLISIEQLFGAVAVRDTKPIDLIVRLISDSDTHIDRLGLTETTEEVLGIRRPAIAVPVAPGRSLALLVECAARKHLLSQRGVPDAAREFLLRHDRLVSPR